MPNGDTGGSGFDFGGIFDPILGGLAALVQSIIDFLNTLVAALVQVLNVLYAGELGILGFSTSGLEHVFIAFKNLMDQIFKVWVVNALHHLLSLYQKLTAWARKLKVWLDRLRKIQQNSMLQALRKYLNLIQRLRRILVVFKLLHIGIAKKLDNYLARLEGRLTTSVFRQLQKTNEIIRWINLIADPRGLLHPGALGSGIGSMIRAVSGALAALKPGAFNCVAGQETGPGVPVRPWLSVSQQLVQESKNKSGDSAAVAAQFQQIHRLFARDIGNVQTASTAG